MDASGKNSHSQLFDIQYRYFRPMNNLLRMRSNKTGFWYRIKSRRHYNEIRTVLLNLLQNISGYRVTVSPDSGYFYSSAFQLVSYFIDNLIQHGRFSFYSQIRQTQHLKICIARQKMTSH